MNEYRMTRSEPYQHECMGRDDLSVRQGHYIQAETEAEAMNKMKSHFPDENEFTCNFMRKMW